MSSAPTAVCVVRIVETLLMGLNVALLWEDMIVFSISVDVVMTREGMVAVFEPHVSIVVRSLVSSVRLLVLLEVPGMAIMLRGAEAVVCTAES